MFRVFSFLVFSALLMSAPFRTASASAQTYTDFVAWSQAVDSFTTITFGEIPSRFVTDQYAEQGLLFTDGDDFTFPGFDIFPLDGHGLDGGWNGKITIDFDSPQLWMGVHYPGGIIIQPFQGTTALTEPLIFGGSGELSNFAGLLFSQPFDSIVLSDVDIAVSIDNLYFGVPAPGALSLLALAALARHRRR